MAFSPAPEPYTGGPRLGDGAPRTARLSPYSSAIPSVSEGPAATSDGPPRRRDTWSLKNIVEEVAGRPIGELQDPSRPMHPYLQAKLASQPPIPAAPRLSHNSGTAASSAAADEPVDPVARIYPPLVGAAARAWHGEEHEHHSETLASVHPPAEPPTPGMHHHPPGPSKRPERIYLHYLLLHLDRLSDTALRYLQHSVNEEFAHRELAHVPAPPPVVISVPVAPPQPAATELPHPIAPPSA